jgi:predicted DNA-binding mobile mystery protein A
MSCTSIYPQTYEVSFDEEIRVKRSQRAQARTAIDAKVTALDVHALAPPPAGWVRAIRDALGMTTRQMAGRMGVTAMAVSGLEESERAGTVQLSTLRRAADALGCDLVYTLVPRVGLDEAVHRQALARARQELQRVDRTMQLEGQGLDASELQRRASDFAAELVDTRAIWDTPHA